MKRKIFIMLCTVLILVIAFGGSLIMSQKINLWNSYSIERFEIVELEFGTPDTSNVIQLPRESENINEYSIADGLRNTLDGISLNDLKKAIIPDVNNALSAETAASMPFDREELHINSHLFEQGYIGLVALQIDYVNLRFEFSYYDSNRVVAVRVISEQPNEEPILFEHYYQLSFPK